MSENELAIVFGKTEVECKRVLHFSSRLEVQTTDRQLASCCDVWASGMLRFNLFSTCLIVLIFSGLWETLKRSPVSGFTVSLFLHGL